MLDSTEKVSAELRECVLDTVDKPVPYRFGYTDELPMRTLAKDLHPRYEQAINVAETQGELLETPQRAISPWTLRGSIFQK